MKKTTTSDLLMAAVFMLCTGIGWVLSNLVTGAIIGIALGLTSVFIYKSIKKQ